jgi:hypothetical protein
MLCAPGPLFVGTEGVGSRFNASCCRTHFWRYQGRRVTLSCFALPDSFSVVPRASGHIIMFCALRHVFGGSKGIGSRFHVLRSRTRFRRYRGRQFPFSCFTLIDSFLAVLRVSGPVFKFYAPGPILGGTEGAGSSLHVSRSRTRFGRYQGCRVQFSCFGSRTRFGRYRGRRVPFSCFALRDHFWALLRASGPILKLRAPGLILGGTEGVRPCFHA